MVDLGRSSYVGPVAAAEYGKDFRSNPVGSGPFVLMEDRPRDQVLVLEDDEPESGS